MMFEEDPTGIVEVPDPLVIDATVEEFSVFLKGINAGRLVFVLMGLQPGVIYKLPSEPQCSSMSQPSVTKLSV